MRIRTLLHLAVSVLITALVSACGDTSSSTSSPTYESVTTATYKIEYIPVTAAIEGKTTFKLRLTAISDGKLIAGKTISLAPKMTMTSMSHSTPCEALKDNSDGTYSGTIYYLMASTASDGTTMGSWELKCTVDGEIATFNPVVAMSMGTTPRISLKGVTDKIGNMTSGMSSRSYYLFNDGISGSTAKLFIAAADDSMMTRFPAVSIGTTLSGLTVATMTVDVSTDKSTWTPLTDDGKGHWSTTGLAMLAAGTHLYVRLTVNGEQKTTDGAAVGASNGYSDFTIGM
jgi:hypothetical protein